MTPVQESVLFCIINLHLVHTADIRLADKSLLEKRHCISVHCTDPCVRWVDHSALARAHLYL